MIIGVEIPLHSYSLALAMATFLETTVGTFQDLEETPDSFPHQPFAAAAAAFVVAVAFAVVVAAAAFVAVVAAAAAVGDVDSVVTVVEVVAVATVAAD